MASTRYYKSYPASAMGFSQLTSTSASSAAALSYQTASTSIISTSIFCYSCGTAGHKAADCTRPRRCYKCGETGHYMKYCGKDKDRNRYKSTPSQAKRQDSQIRNLGQDGNTAVQSLFEKDYADMKSEMKAVGLDGADGNGGARVRAAATGKAGAEAEGARGGEGELSGVGEVPDLIDLSSSTSDDSSVEYYPMSYCRPTERTNKQSQLFSKVVEGYPVKLPESVPVQLTEPSLLDDDEDNKIESEEVEEEKVWVALHRKRKGKKGRGCTYDLTPFLSY